MDIDKMHFEYKWKWLDRSYLNKVKWENRSKAWVVISGYRWLITNLWMKMNGEKSWRVGCAVTAPDLLPVHKTAPVRRSFSAAQCSNVAKCRDTTPSLPLPFYPFLFFPHTLLLFPPSSFISHLIFVFHHTITLYPPPSFLFLSFPFPFP